MGDSVPLQAYPPQMRAWLVPHYERGGITRFTTQLGINFECVDPTGEVTAKTPMLHYRWGMPSRVKFVRFDGKHLHMKIRPWRLFGAQEHQITFYEGNWPDVLANLDSYDLNRNPEWPFKRGAVWLPRGKGASWYQFMEAVRHCRLDDPPEWPYLAEQLKTYEPILVKYGDRLDFLLEGTC